MVKHKQINGIRHKVIKNRQLTLKSSEPPKMPHFQMPPIYEKEQFCSEMPEEIWAAEIPLIPIRSGSRLYFILTLWLLICLMIHFFVIQFGKILRFKFDQIKIGSFFHFSSRLLFDINCLVNYLFNLGDSTGL